MPHVWSWPRPWLPALMLAGGCISAGAQTAPHLGAQFVPFRTPVVANMAAPTAAPAPPSAGAAQVWLQFVNTDIANVARSLGAMTGRQVLVDTRVEGTISLQSPQAVTPSVAWDMFTHVLAERKLSLVPTQGMFVIAPQVPLAAPAQAPATKTPATAAPPPSAPEAKPPGAAQALPPILVPDKTARSASRGPATELDISVEWARPPKPTLNPLPGQNAPPQPSAEEPSAVWSLMTNDKTLYHSISRWAQVANWQLMWEAERDFPIQAQISIEGNFTSAIQLVMNALSNTDYPLQAVMNDATRIISIVRHQQPLAR